ncbi:uncharacterized protein NFIA_049880 [Aspergillus fischeri NRRL 181]|uniref:Hsp70 family chaperone n=1 Tax=Neosartorya fischeri (strain ATCC 1020 / DSM 3700 / CBS 544.65 / FGSC A1164 / JCM 1740 / NRRL 181 / WB 181) TaxID=331117 RepID=A1DLH6_NEOFI|nr:uncharacterized protein NFIA_049880 [Aspergillus fischeri NRRL 181]EAW15647.1 hypothetical protein NFIA_049880 [Aspergillus fischeri NRRL 181]
MAQRSNPPRRVRRKFAHTDSSTSTSSSRISDEDDIQLRHGPRYGQNPLTAKKLLLCLDYGTTLTSISYVTFDPDDPPIEVHPRAVRCVANWPAASRFVNAASPFVPSESWYRDGNFLWGHEVQHTLRNLSENDDVESMNCIIQLPKLLLDDDGESVENDRLSQPRSALRKVGRTAREAIRDYLMKVFKHTHGQLGKYEGFNNTWEVELVLCVPSKWSTYAHLTMQEILLEVVEKTDMKGREFSIFIIDEPEAAVTFALRHENIRENIEKGSNFIVCDAGGGTVDAITYKVRQDPPFRVDEIATPAGKDCGSSYINQAFIKESRERLAHIIELGWEPVYSKEAVLQEHVFLNFEHELKRNYDPADWKEGESRSLRVFGLREDPTRNFGNSMFFITKRSLEGTVDLIREQLEQLNDQEVKVILLLGGFSRSPALKRCLDNSFGRDIGVIISRGGVLRALNKVDGPRRKLRLNLGVCLSEPYDERFPGHLAAPWFYNSLNKKRYDRVVAQGESAEICMHRAFEVGQEMAAYETIYFSDQRVFQHYRIDHSKNRGHRKAGVVEASLDVLRRRNMLEEKINEDGDVYYEVHYSIKLEVNGRNVKATIHCPPGQEVQGEAQICIAAAFNPGTN